MQVQREEVQSNARSEKNSIHCNGGALQSLAMESRLNGNAMQLEATQSIAKKKQSKCKPMQCSAYQSRPERCKAVQCEAQPVIANAMSSKGIQYDTSTWAPNGKSLHSRCASYVVQAIRQNRRTPITGHRRA